MANNPQLDYDFVTTVDFECSECGEYNEQELDAYGNYGSSTAYWEAKCFKCGHLNEGEFYYDRDEDYADRQYELWAGK